MNVEELATAIMMLFEADRNEPGYIMMQEKIPSMLDAQIENLLPAAVALLQSRGCIKCTTNPEDTRDNGLELTKEGYRAINGKDYVPNTDPDNCPCQN